MSFDVMRVRLHLRGVGVTGVVVDTPAEMLLCFTNPGFGWGPLWVRAGW